MLLYFNEGGYVPHFQPPRIFFNVSYLNLPFFARVASWLGIINGCACECVFLLDVFNERLLEPLTIYIYGNIRMLA